MAHLEQQNQNQNQNPLHLIDSLLSKEECQYIITKYESKLVPSLVVQQGTQQTKQDPSRTSSTVFLPDSDATVFGIKQRAAAFLKIPVSHVENLQFLRYKKGERYIYHNDYLPGNPANQRVHTIIVYLNDLAEEDGGATSFYHYKRRVQPQMGLGVWFRNMDDKGALIPESLHAGEEIKTDVVKYALNIWTRQKPY